VTTPSAGESVDIQANLIASLPVAALVWQLERSDDDDSLVLKLANQAASDFAGFDLRARIGARMRDVFPESSPERRHLYAEAARKPMPPRFTGETRSVGGREGRFGVTILSLAHQCVGVLIEKLPAHGAAERDAHVLNAFLDSIIENIPIMVFVKDARTLRFERFNRAGEELLGLPRTALLGKNDYDFFPEEQADFFQRKDRDVLRRRALLDIPEEPIETPRGRRWLHTKKIPLGDEAGEPKYLLGISEDITARKETEEALRLAHHELEERVEQRTAALSRANADLTQEITDRKRAEAALRERDEQLRQAQKMEAIGRLAGGIAHDFNNLLSVILSYSEMIVASLRVGDPLRSDVEQIALAGARARDLTTQLLAFSRQQVLKPEVIDLASVVEGLEPMLARLLGEDIELRIVRGAGAGAGLIKADPGQIEQIILNLAVNARDALPKGGKLDIEVAEAHFDEGYTREHIGVTPGAYMMLAVTDDGVGMDKAIQSRIFEPFFTTKEKGKGTGLGLATVFGIVQQSGGQIWVYSEPGHGTTFKVYLPRTDDAPGARAPSRGVPRGSSRGDETILLVEDEDQVRTLAREILSRCGYQVIHARNAGEAVLLAERHAGPIHLLLTDVIMPQVGGAELARRLSTQRPEMKVLYMSGYTDNTIVHHGILDPGIAFLQKPITPEALTQKVRSTLDDPKTS
jgi:PAS domain S-box-containing protein